MATNYGLSYLSGLLRDGARPFVSPGRAPRVHASTRPCPTMLAHDSPPDTPAVSDRAETFDAPDPSHEEDAARQPSRRAVADTALAGRPTGVDLSDAPRRETSHTELELHERASPSRDEAGGESSPREQDEDATHEQDYDEAPSHFERGTSATSARSQKPLTPQGLTSEALSEKASHFTAGASDDEGRGAALPSAARSPVPDVGPSRNVFSRHDASAHEVETESRHHTPATAYAHAAEGGATHGVEKVLTESRERAGRDSETSAPPGPEGRGVEIIVRGAGLQDPSRHPEISDETKSATASADERARTFDERAITFDAAKLFDAERASASSPKEPNTFAVPRTQVASTTGGTSAEGQTTSHDATEASTASAADAAASRSNDSAPGARESVFRVPPARGTQESPTLHFNARPEPSAPSWLAGDIQSAGERVVTRAGDSAGVVADPTPYTLEAHIAELRSLMWSKRAQTPGDAVKEAAADRKQIAADARRQDENGVIVETRPARTLSAREAAGVATPLESASGAPAFDAASGARATPSQVLARPPNASTVAAAAVAASNAASNTASNAGAPDADLRDADTSPATAQQRARQSPPAPSRARAGGLQERAGVRAGEVPQVRAGAPKLTINRLDVHIVERDAPRVSPSPPQPPPTPLRPDPWGALDRHFLGRFFS